MGEPAEHADNPAAAMFPAIRDNAIAMREEGLDDDAAAARLAAAPMGEGVTMGDLMMADGILARAHAHLVMDPEVLTMAADNRTLGETDVDAPVGVPVLILAAGVQPAFKPEHEERMKATHPTSRSSAWRAPATASTTRRRTGRTTSSSSPRSSRSTPRSGARA